jgi:hypothetical protein
MKTLLEQIEQQMNAEVAIKSIAGTTPPLTIEKVNELLNKKFQEIKVVNPRGFLDQFESQFDGIMMDIGNDHGAFVDIVNDRKTTYIFDFTKPTRRTVFQ